GREVLLLGAVGAPTDAAAVFSVRRRLPLPPGLSGRLEGESGLNDPPAVLAVTVLSSLGGHPPSPALVAGEIVYALAAGAAIGLAARLAGAGRPPPGGGAPPPPGPAAHPRRPPAPLAAA